MATSTTVARMWEGRSPWLRRAFRLIRSPAGNQARRWYSNKARKGPQLMVTERDCERVAEQDALTASAHGGDITTSNKTVAEILDLPERQVERARVVLVRLGLAKVLVRGRYLTGTERQEAHAKHGGRQLRMASRRTLVPPRGVTVGGLPRSGTSCRSKSPSRDGRKRASGAAETKHTVRKSREPVTLGVQRLAVCLVDPAAAAVDVNGATMAVASLDPRWRGGHIGQVWTAILRLAPRIRDSLKVTIDDLSFHQAQRLAARLATLRDRWALTDRGWAHPTDARSPLGAWIEGLGRALDAELPHLSPTDPALSVPDVEPAVREQDERAAYKALVEADAARNRAALASAAAQRDADRARLAADPTVDEEWAKYRAQWPNTRRAIRE